jgi:HAD superfamily hydrolase (TIGR01509 family)
MKLQLPAGTFSAYLFDCDGTVVDSMPLHYIAWKEALREWGGTFDEDLFYSWGGVPPLEIATRLNRLQGLHMPVEVVAKHKESLYFSLLPGLKPVPEVLEHVDAQHGRIPFAVVSGSTRQSVINSLTTVGLLDRFDVLVSSEDYPRSKPAPDAYLAAAAQLGISPAECLVFEDAEIGIQGAIAAGMTAVRVPLPLERRNGTGRHTAT